MIRDDFAPFDGFGTRAYRGLCHFLLTAAFILSAYDRHVLGVLVDPIKADLGLSDTQMGLLQGFAFAICYAVAALPVAWAVDRGNRIRIASGCIALWSAGTAICGLSGNFGMLLSGRTVTAISEAGYSPAALSIISDTFPRKDVPRVSALYLIAPSLGLGLALMGGGALLHHFAAAGGMAVPIIGTIKPWQSVLALSAIPGFVMATLLIMLLREPPRDNQLALPKAGNNGPATFADVMHLHGRFLILYIAGCTTIILVMFTLAAWGASFFSRTYGIEPAAAGSLIGPAVLLGGIAGPLTASFLVGRREGPQILDRMVRIVLIAGASASILVPAMAFAPSKEVAVLLLAAIVLVVSMVAPMIVAPIQIRVPSSLRGRFHASASFLFTIVAGGLGPALVGIVVDYGLQDERRLGAALAIICTASSLLGLILVLSAGVTLRSSSELRER